MNALQGIDFVIVSDDVTESGDWASLQKQNRYWMDEHSLLHNCW